MVTSRHIACPRIWCEQVMAAAVAFWQFELCVDVAPFVSLGLATQPVQPRIGN